MGVLLMKHGTMRGMLLMQTHLEAVKSDIVVVFLVRVRVEKEEKHNERCGI